MSVIEKVLEKAEEAAEAIWKKMYQPDEKTEEDKVETQTDTSAETTTTETSKEDEKPKPEKSEVDYEQKFKTLDGKYKAEVPRLYEEKNKEKARADELAQRIAKLEDDIAKSKTVESSKEIDADLAELELDYPSVAKALKKIKDDNKEKLKSIRDEFQTGVKTELDTVKVDINSAKLDKFDMDMRELGVSDWKQLDLDPKFKDWLSEEVPYTGSTKLDFIQNHAKNRNAKEVAKFFLDYKKSLAGPDEEVKDTGHNKMDKYIAPPKGKSGTAPNLPGESTGLTREAYKKFMDESTTGKFNPAKWGGKTESQVDDMFDAAIASGKLL